MSKILVKAAPQIQIGPDGKPQMYYNVGFGGGGRGGNGVRGRTKRSRVGGALGGAVGVLGGLAGESRSLGGLLSNVQVGAMQGSAVGRGLAGLGTSRRRQARADLEEQAKDDYVKQRASLDFQERQSNPSFASRMNPMNINRRRFEAEQERMQQANRGALTPEEFGRHLAQRRDDSARLARDNTNAQNREMGLAEHKATEAAYNMAQTVDPHQLAQAQQLIAGNIQGPTSGQQMPIQPLSNETSRQITEGEQIPAPDAPYADHDADLTTSQNNLNQFREENPDVQGQEPEANLNEENLRRLAQMMGSEQ